MSSNNAEAKTTMLLDEYGWAKFGPRWKPPRGVAAPELDRYGSKTFGDEWWPGSPWAYLGRELGDELCRLLGAETSDQLSRAEW